jgi:hypothetical protein
VRSASATVSRKLNGATSSSILPASIFEKSRMSLMIVSSDSADWCVAFKYERCSSVMSVSRASSVMPMMPFMGVRISWLMLARKALFASVADSARSLAFIISLVARLRSKAISLKHAAS